MAAGLFFPNRPAAAGAPPPPVSAATNAAIERAKRLERADSLPTATRLLQLRLRQVRAARRPADELAVLALLTSWVSRTDAPLADRYATETVRLARRLGMPQALATAYYHLGQDAYEQQDLPRAAALLRQSVGYFARYDSLSSTYGGALAALSGALLELNQPAAARPYFGRGRALSRRRHDALAEFALLSMWGNGLRRAAPDSAIRYLHQALRLAQTKLRHDPQGAEAETYTQLVLMQIAHNQERWPAALAASRVVAQGAHRLQNQDYEAEALTTMADALRHLGQPATAYDTLARALVVIDSVRGRAKTLELARQQAQLGAVEQEARIRGLEQQRRIAGLRAERDRNRTWVLLSVAVGLGLLQLLGIYLYRRVRQSRTQLAVSDASARLANRTKDRLMAIIGHDLRGPVASFQQVMPLVRHYAEHPNPRALAALADDLEAQAKELSGLLDNLLHWSRSQSNEVRNHPTAVPPAEALAAAAALYRPLADAKGVALRTDAPAQLPPAWADAALLGTVLRNLTSNAIKFTPRGGEVVLGVAACACGGLRFGVRDTGVGMSAGQLAHLFDVAADRTTAGTAGEGGTGLGLLVCQHFVGLLGGQLSVSSQPGQGSLFGFEVAAAAGPKG